MPPVEHRLAGFLWEAGPFLDWAAAADVRFAQDYLGQLATGAGAGIVEGTAYAIPRVAPSAFLRRLDSNAAARADK